MLFQCLFFTVAEEEEAAHGGGEWVHISFLKADLRCAFRGL